MLTAACLLLGCAVPWAQDAASQNPAVRGVRGAHERGGKAPVLVPGQKGQEQGGEAARPAAVPPPGGPPQPTARPPVPGIPPEDAGDPNAPRPMPAAGPALFEEDRPLLEVEGVAIQARELDELVAYFETWRPGSADLLLRDAVGALIPLAAVRARYADALPAMLQEIEAARAALEAGGDFAAVVAQYSDDDEAPSPDGTYELGRGKAVQPFDRLAHTGALGELEGPFLTQYGYHILQITGYRQGIEPREDVTQVRHVLVMFPFRSADPKSEIQELAANARIRILEPGLKNVLPPEYRDQLIP